MSGAPSSLLQRKLGWNPRQREVFLAVLQASVKFHGTLSLPSHAGEYVHPVVNNSYQSQLPKNSCTVYATIKYLFSLSLSLSLSCFRAFVKLCFLN